MLTLQVWTWGRGRGEEEGNYKAPSCLLTCLKQVRLTQVWTGGALHPEPYLCWEINSQLIKIRALEKCPELELHWPPSQSKPVVTNSLNGKFCGLERVWCRGAGEEKPPWLEMVLNPASVTLRPRGSWAGVFPSLSLNLMIFHVLRLRALGRMNRNNEWNATCILPNTELMPTKCEFPLSLTTVGIGRVRISSWSDSALLLLPSRRYPEMQLRVMWYDWWYDNQRSFWNSK